MAKHIKVLADAATPVILRRRKEEAEQGAAYVRPHDVLQGMLDNFDKYNFVDIEDVCGHLLLLVLASVNTTADFAANMLYYLAQYHEHTDKLREEIQEVLSEEAREIEDLAIKDGNTADAPKIIKPSDALTANALKKMVHLDSFVREALRYRSEMHSFTHLARKDLTLSNGLRIPKGRLVAINLRSTHMEEALQGPDPMEFRPWRFVGKGKSASKVGTDFLQFGMGKRACPGRFIATHDLKALVCLTLSRFSKIEIEDPSKAGAALCNRVSTPTVTGLFFTSHH
ncbi:hypothetical protein DFQ26_005517 [Actinomortierella ambigua]|nr:hypothetical protein DFQ26_005517 [Actinomortierella ambigua]